MYLMIGKRISKALAVAALVLVVGLGGFMLLPQIIADTAYPLEYVDEIKFCAGLFNLDEPLMAALILKESGFNPRAISRAGAMGLAQVMPSTFRGIISRVPELQGIGLSSDPFDPKTNICAGAAYLAGALANYDGDWTAALIAYNGGPAAARRYLAARRSTSVLVTETRLYAPKVLAAREVYASMYADRLNGTPDEREVEMELEKPQDKINAFWKGFVKDVFARFISQ